MKVKAIECDLCGDVIYSRAPEDYRECSCGAVSTSGGQQYAKFHIADQGTHKKVIINVDTSPHNLYNDWREMADVFGLISKCSETPVQRHITC